MPSSRLAEHLPSLFGPSRRAAWRLSLARRALAALAILLALHLAVSGVRGTSVASPAAPTSSGPQLTLPLAMPADHLAPGDRVGVYLPGRDEPVVTGARYAGGGESASGQSVARITLSDKEIGPILRQMGPDGAQAAGFVLVRGG